MIRYFQKFSYNSSSSLNSEIKKEPSGSFFGRINTIVRIILQTHTGEKYVKRAKNRLRNNHDNIQN